MKKIFIRLCFALPFAVLVSCGGDNSPKQKRHKHEVEKTKSNTKESIKTPDFKTKKMIKRLAQAVSNIDPDKVSDYLSSNKVKGIDEKIKGSSEIEKIELLSQKASALLNVGQTAESIKIFESLIMQLSGNASANQFLYLMKRQLAIGYMRLGEQQNCIANHNEDSCIIPISSKAQHKLREGSEKTIKLLEELLAINPEDKDAQYVLNIAHMTLGSYPDGVPVKYRIPEHKFQSKVDFPKFKDIASALGVGVNELSGGTCIDDFNNDGHLDIITSSWGFEDQVRYFENDKKGGFVDKTSSTGLVGVYGGLNLRHTDYNNDGFIDFIILRGAWLDTQGALPNSMIKNNGDGTFTDVTIETGLYTLKPTQTAVWADFNLDGWVDLFVANESTPNGINECDLFINQKNGVFKNETREAGLMDVGYFKGVAVGDVNNDRWPDLYVSNFFGKNILYINEGNDQKLGFKKAPESLDIGSPQNSFSTWIFDYNNDGLEDIFVSGYSNSEYSPAALMMDYNIKNYSGNSPHLYRNLGNNKFKEVSSSVGLNEPVTTMGCNIGDLNNDGYLDFYLATGNPNYYSIVPNKMYLNNKGESFDDITYTSGFGHIQKGHAVGFGDLDMDGDQDIYTVMGGALEGDIYSNLLYENPIGNENNWIHIKLVGVESNRAAIGAKIKLTISENGKKRNIYHSVGYDASFGGNSLLAEIGVGSAEKIDKLEVLWPTNKMNNSVFQNVNINQKIRLVENQKEYSKLELPKTTFAKSNGHGHHY